MPFIFRVYRSLQLFPSADHMWVPAPVCMAIVALWSGAVSLSNTCKHADNCCCSLTFHCFLCYSYLPVCSVQSSSMGSPGRRSYRRSCGLRVTQLRQFRCMGNNFPFECGQRVNKSCIICSLLSILGSCVHGHQGGENASLVLGLFAHRCQFLTPCVAAFTRIKLRHVLNRTLPFVSQALLASHLH